MLVCPSSCRITGISSVIPSPLKTARRSSPFPILLGMLARPLLLAFVVLLPPLPSTTSTKTQPRSSAPPYLAWVKTTKCAIASCSPQITSSSPPLIFSPSNLLIREHAMLCKSLFNLPLKSPPTLKKPQPSTRPSEWNKRHEANLNAKRSMMKPRPKSLKKPCSSYKPVRPQLSPLVKLRQRLLHEPRPPRLRVRQPFDRQN
eukprot:Lithocolla_globosa_v1_NODE_1449_length_2569_cov_1158.698886.p3 type:complete len:202 gc:universal NODE_1449_length_2569_cov_1158.698886:1613-2218(+)